MAKATITFSDVPGQKGCDVDVYFDPPLNREQFLSEGPTQAQARAIQVVSLYESSGAIDGEIEVEGPR